MWRQRGLRRGWRRFRWWCGGNSSLPLLGVEGLRGEVIGALGWGVWLTVLCLVQTGDGMYYPDLAHIILAEQLGGDEVDCNKSKGNQTDVHSIDYLHLTKRFGIIGASQLPIHYLLAFKTPYSPLQALTRQSWESLNCLHQLLGRIVTLFFYLHTAFYINFFIRSNLLAKRIRESDVILGLFAITAFTTIGTTALSWVRKRNYRIFYATHVVLATILLPVLYFHVHHIRIYVWETLAVYVLHFVFRVFNERTVAASVALVPGTKDLLAIEIPLRSSSVGEGESRLKTWQPGQHVYLSLQRSGLLTRPIRSKNPFTIASLPTEDGTLKLVARVMDGNTAALAKEVGAAGRGASATTRLTIEGPYGLATHCESLLGYSRVLFVAGGVGATFIVPLYRSLLRDLSPSAGSRRRQNVKFAWAVREVSETSWAMPDDPGEAKGFKERLSVYVTRGTSAARVVGQSADRRVDEAEDAPVYVKTEGEDDMEDGVEMTRLLPSGDGDETSPAVQGGKGVDVEIGRPDVRALVNQTFAGTNDSDKVGIFVCGPKGLARNVRNEVGRWMEKREVWFWSEEFGL